MHTANRALKGFIVLAFDLEGKLLLSKRNKLYRYCRETDTIGCVFTFPPDIKSQLGRISNKIRRLLRSDIRYGLVTSSNTLILAYAGKLHFLSASDYKYNFSLRLLRGSRPLNISEIRNISGFENGLYFGEYFSNPSKESCHIYKIKDGQLKIVYTFPHGAINHVHNIISDPANDCVWILTGDFEGAAAIHRATNEFEQVETIVSGEQAYRSCIAFPHDGGLIFATDSQFQQNFISELRKGSDGWKVEKIFPLNGPCIYGCKIGDRYYFSTAVEAINDGPFLIKLLRTQRGPGIIENISQIIAGNSSAGYREIYAAKKDLLPFVAFQFGNILFPSGRNHSNYLAFSNIGLVESDCSTQIIDL